MDDEKEHPSRKKFRWWHIVFLFSLASLVICLLQLFLPPPFGLMITSAEVAKGGIAPGCADGLEHCICPISFALHWFAHWHGVRLTHTDVQRMGGIVCLTGVAPHRFALWREARLTHTPLCNAWGRLWDLCAKASKPHVLTTHVVYCHLLPHSPASDNKTLTVSCF